DSSSGATNQCRDRARRRASGRCSPADGNRRRRRTASRAMRRAGGRRWSCPNRRHPSTRRSWSAAAYTRSGASFPAVDRPSPDSRPRLVGAMAQAKDHIDRLRIAEPCRASWESMAGDERVRHCTLCSLNVYNFSNMTRDEVRQLLAKTEGRVCARLYRRADGTVLTRDCPEGIRALRRRASRIAATLVAALLSLPSVAFGRITWKKPRHRTEESVVTFQSERVAATQPAVLDGLVRSQDGYPLPGVTVTVRD